MIYQNVFSANYQALALVALYVWHLKKEGCQVSFEFDQNLEGATKMWRLMGAIGWSQVLANDSQNFRGNRFKPLIAVRNQADFSKALSKVEEYTKGFNVEYEKTLRYVISELLYNTLEHGGIFYKFKSVERRLPSIMQFTWYQQRNELQFIIADLGIGIKKHLEQAYPVFENADAAIRATIRPNVSGTFGQTDPYVSKNNAGVGLFISSNIVRRLTADMHIISDDGLVHISPRDVTGKTIRRFWPGTIVLINVRLGDNADFNLHGMMAEFRQEAVRELEKGSEQETSERFYVNVQNYFGPFAEDKEAAIKFRDRRILSAIEKGQSILLDFDRVISAPHSFLSALLATPVRRLGLLAYKKIKIVNATAEIRETIDYILDENTVSDNTSPLPYH